MSQNLTHHDLSLVEVVATSFTERGLDEVDPWSGDQNPCAHFTLLRSLPVIVLAWTAYENLLGLASWCSAVACRLKKKS